MFNLCNNNTYYKPRGGKMGLSKRDISIMTWFEMLKECVDKMPDEDKWQLTAPFKKTVWKW